MIEHIDDLLEKGYATFDIHNFHNDLFEELNQILLLVENYEKWTLYIAFRKENTSFSEIETFEKELQSFLDNPNLYRRMSLNPFPGDETSISLEFEISLNNDNLENVKEIVENFTRESYIQQYWFKNDFWDGGESKLDRMIHSKADLILDKIYTHFYPYEYEEHKLSITNFKENCLIHPHQDGQDENRVCGILIYMNHDYPEDKGGELVVGDTVIRPKFGTIVALDYTENNLEHSVNKVAHNDNRFALLKFFSKKH
jgi:Rps23 Pro-64 3,4-dihydroxylase Tpa1-like proline 4-hydroxylase